MASEHWDLIHAERARLAEVLAGLSAEQWHADSLCAGWSVEQVTAHLTAAANTGTWAWMRSMVRAGFNTDRHNARLLARYLGNTPPETLDGFRNAVMLTVAPTKDHPAWLGEVIAHGQDITRPLGIALTPDAVAVRKVADFYAATDFAVNSRSLIRGLSLEADDAGFRAGVGPVVRGPLLDLVMAMAGRPVACANLDGDGVGELRRRLA